MKLVEVTRVVDGSNFLFKGDNHESCLIFVGGGNPRCKYAEIIFHYHFSAGFKGYRATVPLAAVPDSLFTLPKRNLKGSEQCRGIEYPGLNEQWLSYMEKAK